MTNRSRLWTIGALLVALSLVVAACNDDDGAATTTDATAATTEAPAPTTTAPSVDMEPARARSSRLYAVS